MADESPDVSSQPAASSTAGGPAAPPQLSLPKGGGAIHGIGEKFAANPVTGTGSLTVPIATSPGRSGFGPQLALSYDSGSGNGPFGLGWSLALPSITRKTDKGLPRYQDADESDVFILSGAEDLVPVLVESADGEWARAAIPPRDGYNITQYRPRVEGLFARIERWTRQTDGDTYWRSISKDNVTTFYGETPESRIADPEDSNKVFSWLICQSQDDKGNAMVYSYSAGNLANIDLSEANERNRSDASRSANRYLQRVRYGNTQSLLIQPDVVAAVMAFRGAFRLRRRIFRGSARPMPTAACLRRRQLAPSGRWPARQDPFSHHRSCFEVRTYRLCRRVLMFHHFEIELGVPDYLVRLHGVLLSGKSDRHGDDRRDAVRLRAAKRRLLAGLAADARVRIQSTADREQVREVDPESLANLPATVDGSRYRWLDLDGEGLQCILAEQDGAWFYKRNLTPLSLSVDSPQLEPTARFEALSRVSQLPGIRPAPNAAPSVFGTRGWRAARLRGSRGPRSRLLRADRRRGLGTVRSVAIRSKHRLE